jgi:hypothetical protein
VSQSFFYKGSLPRQITAGIEIGIRQKPHVRTFIQLLESSFRLARLAMPPCRSPGTFQTSVATTAPHGSVCPSLHKWGISDFKSSERFAHQFYVTRPVFDIANADS